MARPAEQPRAGSRTDPRAGSRTDPRADPLGVVNPVVVRSAAAQVADQLVQAVRGGRLQPGDRFPAERELAQRFAVSRPTVREALAALELAGIVRTYQGRGTVVVGTSSQVGTWGVEVLPPQVFEARLAVEPTLAALAAEKRYPEDVERLREAYADLTAEFARTGTYESDLPVHRAIARAARNPILERALEDALAHTSSTLWRDLRRRALAEHGTRAAHVEETGEAVECVARGDAERAAALWRRHLELFRDEMLGRSA